MPAPTIVFYISGHGFGHASRSIECINAMLERYPGLRVHVRTMAPRWLFELTVRGEIEFHEVETDVGVVQVDALRPDIASTLARARAFYATSAERIAHEADMLRGVGADVVLADIPPLAFAAADAAGIPAIALSNFTWDWIYEDYEEAVGVDRTLSRQLRAWQAMAAGAWRLPMHGGFEGIRTVRDLPLVARHSRRSRAEVREAFHWDATRPVLLVSFGGVGLTGLPLDRVAAHGDFLVVTTDEPSAGRPPDGPIARTTRDGVVVLDERRLYDAGWRYEDIVSAADVVVTKPGYGIVAECVAHQVAVLYTSRGRFAEYAALVAAMPRWLRCRFIDQEQLMRGAWDSPVRELIAQPAAPERVATNGAQVVADWVGVYLAGAGRLGSAATPSDRSRVTRSSGC